MAARIIACCGLVCSECESYVATQQGDMARLAQVAAQWSQEYGVSLAAEDCLCDGCLGDGRQIGHCAECRVRLCAVERGVVNCAHCADYGCATLADFFQYAPAAKATLEQIRRALQQ